ncbi:MAG: hypothetical protein L0F92_08915, partial [Pseudomonas sp.]|nr:hypothetical protein [Pseudomonas sp.]
VLYTVLLVKPYFVGASLLGRLLRELARSHSCSVSAAASFIRQLVRMACDPISQGGHNVFFYVILVAARGLDDF